MYLFTVEYPNFPAYMGCEVYGHFSTLEICREMVNSLIKTRVYDGTWEPKNWWQGSTQAGYDVKITIRYFSLIK